MHDYWKTIALTRQTFVNKVFHSDDYTVGLQPSFSTGKLVLESLEALRVLDLKDEIHIY